MHFKNFFISGLFLSLTFSGFSFDWPQNEVTSDKFLSYFGQYRGETIGTSLVFSETEEVKAVDNGFLLISLQDDNYNFFPSTLGSAIIVQHKDNIQTVYGNLDKDTFNEEFSKDYNIKKGEFLASVTSSGWQHRESALVFSVIDTKKHTVINPRILMPRAQNEQELFIRNLTAKGKKASFTFPAKNVVDSGVYLLYHDRQESAVPFKSVVFVNGTVTDTISFSVLHNEKGKLFVEGKKYYDIKTVYPDSKQILTGEIQLTKGQNQIRVILSDILGNEKTAVYYVDVR